MSLRGYAANQLAQKLRLADRNELLARQKAQSDAANTNALINLGSQALGTIPGALDSARANDQKALEADVALQAASQSYDDLFEIDFDKSFDDYSNARARAAAIVPTEGVDREPAAPKPTSEQAVPDAKAIEKQVIRSGKSIPISADLDAEAPVLAPPVAPKAIEKQVINPAKTIPISADLPGKAPVLAPMAAPQFPVELDAEGNQLPLAPEAAHVNPSYADTIKLRYVAPKGGTGAVKGDSATADVQDQAETEKPPADIPPKKTPEELAAEEEEKAKQKKTLTTLRKYAVDFDNEWAKIVGRKPKDPDVLAKEYVAKAKAAAAPKEGDPIGNLLFNIKNLGVNTEQKDRLLYLAAKKAIMEKQADWRSKSIKELETRVKLSEQSGKVIGEQTSAELTKLKQAKETEAKLILDRIRGNYSEQYSEAIKIKDPTLRAQALNKLVNKVSIGKIHLHGVDEAKGIIYAAAAADAEKNADLNKPPKADKEAKPKELSGTEAENLFQAKNQYDTMSVLIGQPGLKTAPLTRALSVIASVAGLSQQKVGAVKEELIRRGNDDAAAAAEVFTRISASLAATLQALSGAGVAEGEVARVGRMLPNEDDTPAVFAAKAKAVRDEAARLYASRHSFYKTLGKNLGELPATVTGPAEAKVKSAKTNPELQGL